MRTKPLGTGPSETWERRFSSPWRIGELRNSIRGRNKTRGTGCPRPSEKVGVTRHQIVLRDHKRWGLKNWPLNFSAFRSLLIKTILMHWWGQCLIRVAQEIPERELSETASTDNFFYELCFKCNSEKRIHWELKCLDLNPASPTG